jgi:uncharacterized membrane protein
LGNPWTAIAAAIGSGIADLMHGSVIYIMPTIIIKGTMGLIASLFAKKHKPLMFGLGTLVCGCIMCGGYFAFELFLYLANENAGGMAAAVYGLGMNTLQASVCAACAWLLYKPTLELKKRLRPINHS